ncbi:MAG: ImmA/IrrE family metallo-endopeptidase [Spirochaetia bacterium]|jgi:hypothetical protein|nr:ImmA/IrrE family metallo-endopeptidase [Spirochaetia bacterium]
MTTDNLLEYADRCGYAVIYDEFPECGSLSVDVGGGCIGIDCHVAGREEKVRIAHEVGHCETGSFYSRHMPNQCMQQLENRANRWAYNRVVPFEDIQAAIHAGYVESWELADHFDVTDEFMVSALAYYHDVRGLDFQV